METHSILSLVSVLLSMALQNFPFPCPSTRGLQIDNSSVMSLEVKPDVQMYGLLVVIVVADDFPVR